MGPAELVFLAAIGAVALVLIVTGVGCDLLTAP
jgi:hypothetical protein